MKLQFSGQEHFDAPPHEVFRFLTDIDSLTASIPDLVSAERVDDGSLRCVVRPGFSFLRGTMKLLIRLDELQPPESARMLVDSQGIGVTIKAESDFKISPDGGDSRLDWQTRVVEMKGLIATVSPGLIQAAANQVTKLAWEKIRQRLDSGA